MSDTVMRCPKCKSTNIMQVLKFHCMDCGKSFRKQKNRAGGN